MNEFFELQNKIDKIEDLIDISFDNKNLLILSFVHSSFINENKKIVSEHNERLEFLGDSALSLVVSAYLYQKLSKEPEGKLSHIRSRLVDAKSCAKYYEDLKLFEFVLMGKGEKEVKRGKIAIYSDAFEALIGAIYLDKGFLEVQKFLLKNFSQVFDKIATFAEVDYKGALQEYCQKNYQKIPKYKIIEEKGPEHLKTFKVGVFLDEKKLAQGTGSSKKIAEILAAKNAYKKLKKDEN
jgi:ribonuclease III